MAAEDEIDPLDGAQPPADTETSLRGRRHSRLFPLYEACRHTAAAYRDEINPPLRELLGLAVEVNGNDWPMMPSWRAFHDRVRFENQLFEIVGERIPR